MPRIDPRGRRARKDVTVRLVTREISVPGGISILNALAAVSGPPITEGNYCGAGECAHCEVIVLNHRGHKKSVLACRTRVEDGLQIVRLSKYLEADLSS